MTVVIIGAGAAGLTAAFTLVKAGLDDFVILEASDRLGGRVKKLENKSFASFPIDLGAEWIHNGLDSLKEISQDSQILDKLPHMPVSSIPDSYQAWNGQDKGFVDVEDDDWHTVDDYFWVNYSWFDFFNDTIAIPEVRDSIVFDCPVDTIDYSGGDLEGVKVTCPSKTVTDGSEKQTFEASHALVTVPLKILQEGDIIFTPELPDRHQTSIESIPFPPGFKIFLKFSQNFGYQNSAFYSNLDPLLLYFYDETFGQLESEPKEHLMGVFVSDFAAQDAAQLSDQELIDMALRQLDSYFPDATTPPSQLLVEGVVQNWVKEPCVRGTYSHYESDSWRHMDRLKQPLEHAITGDPVVYLAGEALPATTQDYNNGYAHGAALSGKETIQWIIEELPKSESSTTTTTTTTTTSSDGDGGTDSDSSGALSSVTKKTELFMGVVLTLLLLTTTTATTTAIL